MNWKRREGQKKSFCFQFHMGKGNLEKTPETTCSYFPPKSTQFILHHKP